MSKSQEQPKKLMNVSSSKISDLWKCSAIFYYKHVLGLPDEAHWKTLVGSALHNVVEYTLKPKRRALLDSILENGFSFSRLPSIDRYCKMWRDKHDITLWDHQNLEDMLALTFSTLKPYLGPGEFKSEQRFELKIGDAIISGYVDIAAIGKHKHILDMKTKGSKFTKKELIDNIQAAIYQMWYYETYGELVPATFIMTRFPPTKLRPQNHLQSVPPPTEAQIRGLKPYLARLHKVMNGFTEKDMASSFCSDEGFCFRVCQFKDPKSYMVVTNRDGTGQERRYWIDPKDIGELPYQVKEHETYVIKEHPGCPRWNS